jgi:hypothetical protein
MASADLDGKPSSPMLTVYRIYAPESLAQRLLQGARWASARAINRLGRDGQRGRARAAVERGLEVDHARHGEKRLVEHGHGE